LSASRHGVLIRHLTGDLPAQARRAHAFLATADELLVPDLIVAEVVYVLESFYEVEGERVAELVRATSSRGEAALESLRIVRSRVDDNA